MIDLRSDTVTEPSTAMREAAADAEVGDDVYGEDPTVDELEATFADLVGKEAAVFVPSGTMGNQVAASVHAEPGQEVLLERDSHVYRWELGGLAAHSGLQTRPVDGGDRGVVTSAAVAEGYVEADDHRPGTGLLWLENTHNAKGGTAIAADRIDAACEAAHERGVPVHLDGARLFNAVTALGTDAARLARAADSVMCCLSKGLGAPVGSLLAGSEAFVAAARRERKRFGGGMRQVGVVAAPGLVALENRQHLAADHENARLLADGLDDVDGLSAAEPETNVVVVETPGPADGAVARWEAADVRCGAVGPDRVRLCTHLDVDRADVEEAVRRIAAAETGA